MLKADATADARLGKLLWPAIPAGVPQKQNGTT
jgi:hypothetical protein